MVNDTQGPPTSPEKVYSGDLPVARRRTLPYARSGTAHPPPMASIRDDVEENEPPCATARDVTGSWPRRNRMILYRKHATHRPEFSQPLVKQAQSRLRRAQSPSVLTIRPPGCGWADFRSAAPQKNSRRTPQSGHPAENQVAFPARPCHVLRLRPPARYFRGGT